MDTDRISRYREKIAWATNRCTQIQEWIAIYGSTCIMDQMPLLAIFKAYQEMTESLMDIIAMQMRDINLPARDDYTNIERALFLSIEHRKRLIEMNGLRNRIIHRYNSTDEEIALERIEFFIPIVYELLDEIRLWMKSS